MAKRTVRAGYLARRIEELRATGLTRKQVAAQTGIGERTQRKLISGQTSGARWFQRIRTTRGIDIPRSAEPGHFSIVVRRPDGGYARVPIILRDYDRAKHLTPFDKARILRNAAVQETIESELQKTRQGSPPMSRAEIEASTVADVVPIVHSHTANIPVVWLGTP